MFSAQTILMRLSIPSPSLNKSLRYSYSVPGHTPSVLFEHGRDVDVIPKVPGFKLYVEGGRFVVGAAVRVQLAVAQLSAGIGFEGEVITSSLDEGIAVLGEVLPFGGATLWLNMNQSEEGTQIDYGINMRAGHIGMLPMLTLISLAVDNRARDFAGLYEQNVVRAIAANTLP
jgi:hypothetical protein